MCNQANSSLSLSSSTDSLISISSLTSSLEDLSQLSLVSTPIPEKNPVDRPTNHVAASLDPLNLGVLNGGGMEKASRREDELLPEVFCESRARIPLTTGGEVFLHVYRNNVDNKEHIAFVFGDEIHSKTLFERRAGESEEERMVRGAYEGVLYPGRSTSGRSASGRSTSGQGEGDLLVRIHSECYTGETAWSARCDCGEQLEEAARQMALEGRGVIIYLRQEGRGIGLAEKLKAYNLQDLGADTVTANLLLRHPADGRSFGLATAMLLDLGCEKIRLMTNNPDKIEQVEGKKREIQVSERVAMVPLSWQHKGGFKSREVDQYLKTKIERMGHMLAK